PVRQGRSEQGSGAGLLQARVRRGHGPPVPNVRAATRRDEGSLPAADGGGGVPHRSLPRGAGVDRRVSGPWQGNTQPWLGRVHLSRGAEHAAHRARPRAGRNPPEPPPDVREGDGSSTGTTARRAF